MLTAKRARYKDTGAKIAEEGKRRVVDPKPFDGRDHGAYLVFIRACERVFAIWEETYRDDKDRVLYATSFLAGNAELT